MPLTRHSGFRDRRVQPLRHLSIGLQGISRLETDTNFTGFSTDIVMPPCMWAEILIPKRFLAHLLQDLHIRHCHAIQGPRIHNDGVGRLSTRDVCSRRRFLALAAGGVALLASSRPALAALPRMPELRVLAMTNTHTGASASVPFRSGARYLPEGLTQLNHLLLDHRTGDTHTMDPRLFDLIFDIQTDLRRRWPSVSEIEIISGYRSPQSNMMLASHSSGVAKGSYHMKGQAIDFRIPGTPLEQVRAVAMDQRVGGVGFYRGSNFVHIDTGPVRHW